MPGKPNLSQGQIERLLQPIGNFTDLTPLKEGAERRAFTVKRDGQVCVLRVGMTRVGFDKDTWAYALFSAKLPVPEIYEIASLDEKH